MSDVNFMNAYNDVVLENFMAVLKQNFMFQTQIKFLEERVSLIPALEEKGKLYDSVVKDKQELENKIISLNPNIYLYIYFSQLRSDQGTPHIFEYAQRRTFWSILLLPLLNSMSLVAKYKGYTLSQAIGTF